MVAILEFEKPAAELLLRAAELRAAGNAAEAGRIEAQATAQLAEIYARLTPWQRTQVARHPERPHFRDYIAGLVKDFTPLAGDRNFGDDKAIVGGLGRFRGRTLMVIGHEKGADTASRVAHNFGMGAPEGYRKAARLMTLAAQSGVPVLTLVDTPGAYPGVEGEARGIAEAIARATQVSLDLPVPMIAAIVGEGMSGGAIGLAAADRVLMLENAVYAVISPEASSAILFRGDPAPAQRAAETADAMQIGAADLFRMGIVDRVVPEPPGGAQRHPAAAIAALGDAVEAELDALDATPPEALRRARRARFLAMGRAA